MANKQVKKPRGRPRSEVAASRDAILDAVFDILHEKSVRDLSIEEVARRSGVGKPTIYKWWPSKAALVMDMLDARSTEDLSFPSDKNAEQALRDLALDLVKRFNKFPGKVAVEILAEGQSDPDVLEAYRQRYQSKRRTFAAEVIQQGQSTGKFRKDIDPEVLIDMIFGPIYFRRIVRHQNLTERFCNELVDRIMSYIRL
jgi:AcrR family transcriptional regulator